MIEIRNLTKIYYNQNKAYTALEEINYTLPNTGFVAIYGENGCGKTTLLNILATIDEDYQGSIKYNGCDYKDLTNRLRRNEISYVFQDEYFIDYLSIEENLLLFSEQEDNKEVLQQLALYDISQKNNSMAISLSGGQRQRASFIRGILKESKVLLVDEPTSGMNEEMERFVFEKLKTVSRTKLVILVSHNVRLIKNYSDLIIHIDNGKIVNSEKIYAQIDQVVFHKDYIAIPTSNFDLGGIDKNKIRKRLEKDKKICFSVVENEPKGDLLNYDREEINLNVEPKRMGKKVLKKIIWKSFKQSKVHIIFIGILICLLSMIFTYLLHFNYYDDNKFIYQSLIENVGNDINYREDKSVTSKEKKKFNENNYLYVKTQLNEKIQILSDFEYHAAANYDGDGIYDERIYGYVYYEKNDVELIWGKEASQGTVLITDYIADGYLKFGNVCSSYDDILKKGIIINSTPIKISGIVNTNYEEYLDCYMLDSFKQSQRYIDFLNEIDYWGRLYCPYSLLNYPMGLFKQPINNGEFLSDMKLIEDSDMIIENNFGCYISSSLAKKLKDCDDIKTSIGLVKIEGVIDDEDIEDVIYMTNELLNEIRHDLLNNIEHLRVKVSDRKTIQYLGNNGMVHETSISPYIIKTLNVIGLLKNFFSALLLITLLLITITSLYLQTKIIGQDNLIIAFCRLIGYSKRYMYWIEMIKTMLLFLILGLSNIILFCGSVYLINFSLSKIFDMAIMLANINFAAISTMLFTLLTILSIITIIVCFYKNHVGINKLIIGETKENIK